MYVLSHGCLLSLYKAFFIFSHMTLPITCINFHWMEMSLCSLCLLSVRSLMLWILPCIPRCCHLLHVGSCRSIWKILRTSLQISMLHPRHHSFWIGLLYILGCFFIAGRFCVDDVTTFIILFSILNCLHLFFGTSLILLFLYAIVRDLSYKSNSPVVWLEHS